MIAESIEKIECDLQIADACLETVGNSLFFAEERKDRDMAKPASVCVEVIRQMIEKAAAELEDVLHEYDKTDGAKD